MLRERRKKGMFSRTDSELLGNIDKFPTGFNLNPKFFMVAFHLFSFFPACYYVGGYSFLHFV